MSLKVATAALVAMAVTSGPALACMGPTVIFQDTFQTADPAWSALNTPTAISGGHAQVTAPTNGEYSDLRYEGMFMTTGDYCVNMLSPTVQDPTTALAGIMFGASGSGFYVFLVEEDGQAEISLSENGGWLNPVSMRAAPALKTGGNVTNTLRVTFKGNSASAYINGQPFITFNIPQAFQNTMIGFYAENDAASGSPPITYTFSNLKVTNVP